METAQRRPPIMAFENTKKTEYVTVVSVGTTGVPEKPAEVLDTVCAPGFVTVLKIGDTEPPNKEEPHLIEQVLVYRLPGERLGFGLKFEGGTKAAEFVKRLFIQSCAPDSPASRVRGSWGALVEGDEVLAIDSVPVNSMTRIDCVRCLKDSNVVIKLLVKHLDNLEAKGIVEDLPLVIGAEKKRTPPPPPPVPPRKVPRKKELLKEKDTNVDPVPQSRNSSQIQRPRDRKFSDDVPPDAEVYLDLFSQEQEPYCLSESDDTGSSISTVVDRFGSFPTTTTSSFAGSMPSTPTAIQKRIDLSQIITNPFDQSDDQNDNYLFDKLTLLQAKEQHQDAMLQPPANFQDAPLSYADEDVRIMPVDNHKRRLPPPPPPRSKHTSKERNNNDYNVQDENQKLQNYNTQNYEEAYKNNHNINSNGDCIKNNYNIEKHEKNLPRLVDFVPKSHKSEAFDSDILKSFIENEQKCHSDAGFHDLVPETEEDDDEVDDGFIVNNWNDSNTWYASNWSPTQLPTIGEADDEEERGHEQRKENETIVIQVEQEKDQSDESDTTSTDTNEECHLDEVDGKLEEIKQPVPAPRTTLPISKSTIDVEVMDNTPPPSINTRQPPDGHEFPDYHETHLKTTDHPKPRPSTHLRKDQQAKTSVKNMIAKFSTNEDSTTEPDTTTEKKIFNKSTISSTPNFENVASPHSNINKPLDLAGTPLKSPSSEQRLHTRSQSLVDLSSTNDRWAQILEQRRKGMSKLKGLVIPEHADVVDSGPIIDLPEIKSDLPELSPSKQFLPNLELKPLLLHNSNNHARNNSTPCLTTPLWTDASMKYSPAFKRKTLQVCTSKSNKLPIDDPPKSLESITSPTRSDCSFEYASGGSSPERLQLQEVVKDNCADSDSDSALSSSQSSYVSRQSPPASPTRLHQNESSRRLLKAQSVEAINRKNILASAKCRSGKDLNGSPQIQRKFEEETTTQVTQPLLEQTPLHLDRISEKSKSKLGEKKESINQRLNNLSSSVVLRNHVANNKYIASSRNNNAKSASVTDLRKNFEKAGNVIPSPIGQSTSVKISSKVNYGRYSTITKNGDVNSTSKPTPSKRNSLPILTKNIKPAAVLSNAQAIIALTIKQWDETINAAELKVITLQPDIPGCNIGITLAGGTDYETKDITIHKVRNGSVAQLDGRLQKGDRIFSINGKSMNGITHAQSIAILKEPVDEVILVTAPGKEPSSPLSPVSPTPPISVTVTTVTTAPLTNGTSEKTPVVTNKQDIGVKLFKDLATSSLGFSLEGGKESPQGDLPLTIKKLFTGGIADKCGLLAIGDELLQIQNVDVSAMSRIDVWAMMKKIPVGEVTLKIRR